MGGQFHTHQLGWRTSWVYNIGGASCSLQMPAYSALNCCKDFAGFNVSIRGLVRSSHGSDFGLPWLLDARVLWWLTDSKQPEHGMLCWCHASSKESVCTWNNIWVFLTINFHRSCVLNYPLVIKGTRQCEFLRLCAYTHIDRYIYIYKIIHMAFPWKNATSIYRGFPN